MSANPTIAFGKLSPDAAEEVLALYRATAAGRGGLARTPAEIDLAYVRGFLTRAAKDGLTIGARAANGALCGEIHAARIGPALFRHVLSDLTVAVHPDWQGRAIGSRLFEQLFAEAALLSPKIERIELMARSGNDGAIKLYERLGFHIEGRFARRVRLADGTVEDDIAMAKLV